MRGTGPKRGLAAAALVAAVCVWIHRACVEPPYAASFRPDAAPAEGSLPKGAGR